MIGPPQSQECALALELLEEVCATLKVLLARHKRDGLATCLTFLGIEVDTVASKLRLPQEKLTPLQSLLSDWGERKVCHRRELKSLVEILHACKAVHAGCSFLRRMLDLLKGSWHHPLHPHSKRLNRSFRSNLMWWRLFAARWNGVSFLPPPADLPCLQIASDASGSWDCGVAEHPLVPAAMRLLISGTPNHGQRVAHSSVACAV